MLKERIEHHRDIVTEVSYPELEMMLDVFHLPCTWGPHPWKGVNTDDPWSYRRAGIDLRANLKELESITAPDSLIVNISVVYEISRIGSREVVAAGDFRINQVLTGVSRKDGLYVRMFTEPFHVESPENEGKYKLSLEIANGDKKRIENHILDVRRGVYNIMLVSKRDTDPYSGIPEFKRRNPNGDIIVHRGDEYHYFMPVTDIYPRGDGYYGEGDVLFVKQHPTGGGRTYVSDLIQLGREGSPVPEGEHRNFNTLRQAYSDLSLGQVFVEYQKPNRYFVGSVRIPDDTPSGHFSIIIPVLSDGPNGIEVITEGYLDVMVVH